MKNKKFLTVLLAVLLFVLLGTVTAFATDPVTGSCGDNLTYTWDADSQTLTISGTGEMDNYSDSVRPPWNSYRHIQLVVEEGVTSIGDYAFGGDRDGYLSSVSLPSTLTRIGTCAFYFRYDLLDIDLPEGLISIGAGAFAACYATDFGTLPSTLVDIGDMAFMYAGIGIGAYVIPERDLVFSNSVERIGSMAFYDCVNVRKVRIGTGIQSIGAAAFGVYGDEIPEQYQNVPSEVETCLTESEWNAVTKNVLPSAEALSAMGMSENEANEYLTGVANLPSFPVATTFTFEAHNPGAEVIENRVEPQSCGVPGSYDVVRYCTLCNRAASREAVPVTLPHTFGEPTWTWSSDNKKATVSVTCGVCEQTLTQTVNAKVSNSGGYTVYTVTATIDDSTFTTSKKVGASNNGDRCPMCPMYDEYKTVPVASWVVTIVHFFIHMIYRMSSKIV